MKVTFDVISGRLAIEGDGPDLLKVLEAARSLAPTVGQIQIITSPSNEGPTAAENSEPTGGDVTPQAASNAETPKTLRQFARALTLSNSAEKIAAIAYYVNKIEGRPSFSPKEMDGWFTMCGFQKPSQMPVALYDAKRKYGYADNIGRGMWRISNQGENLIIGKTEDSRS